MTTAVDKNDQIEVSHEAGGLARVILNRPDKRNAFDADIIRGLTDALTELNRDRTVRVVILEGRGKHFSAGADLEWMRSTAAMSEADNQQDALALAGLMTTLDRLSKPTIVAVQGAAFGGALGLICCCDIAIASDQARFCLSEVRLGLAPAAISPYVVRAMGHRQSRRYMLTAEVFAADTAAQLNLVHDVVPEAELAERVAYYCDTLLKGGPEAQAACKNLLQHLDNPAEGEAIDHLTARTIARLRTGREGQEGLNAFFEKRPPAWTPSCEENH